MAEKEGRAESCSSNSSSETAAREVLSGSKRESQCAKGGDTDRLEIGEKFTLRSLVTAVVDSSAAVYRPGSSY